MKKSGLIIALLLTQLVFHPTKGKLFAQKMYRSRMGTVSVTTTYWGLPVTAHGKQVEFVLDTETSSITLTLAPGDLHVPVDSLNRLMSELKAPLVLRGRLKPGGIDTTTHPPQTFQFEGMLELTPDRKIEINGVGRLEHIGGGEELACELAIYFNIDARSLGLHKGGQQPEEQHVVKVQFFQTVLSTTY